MGSSENEELIAGVMAGLDLPPGFTPLDLHAMLDTGCDGTLSTSEFIEGMFRMVFSNDFHRACMSQLSLNHIKLQVVQMNNKIQHELDDVKESLKLVVNELQVQRNPSKQNSFKVNGGGAHENGGSAGGDGLLTSGSDTWRIPSPPVGEQLHAPRQDRKDEMQVGVTAAAVPIDKLIDEMRAELRSLMADILAAMKEMQASSNARGSGPDSFEVGLQELQAKAIRLKMQQASLTATDGAGSRWRNRTMCCAPSTRGELGSGMDFNGWSEEVTSSTQASRTRTITVRNNERSLDNMVQQQNQTRST
eukprot:gnl/TRDRNA2_/TRDRNA2_166956_c3_seq2.p1 gnl/TRDRNA2_/TRDRNA2_166956_c3~~gnl/TRDRNA2_/TRDRNA2_166956_c3_seq2.p1  ORF type:complete len:337 (+),score=72.94 gnl/TRDRNA2_/TRDRNA2_166956_c3_seq2:97-1011(+)